MAFIWNVINSFFRWIFTASDIPNKVLPVRFGRVARTILFKETFMGCA
ncbi:MAG TPA: hypothetical protein VLM75_03715 [Spirochaetota bacterium]|nr:hypothetical protein [Spirochaetota bacterium]